MDATSEGRRSPSEPAPEAEQRGPHRLLVAGGHARDRATSTALWPLLVADPDARVWVDLIDPAPDVVALRRSRRWACTR